MKAKRGWKEGNEQMLRREGKNLRKKRKRNEEKGCGENEKTGKTTLIL